MSDTPPPPQKIALFGGTFNPVHLGHLHLAGLAREALALDEVRFIPCALSPHKQGTHPASAEHRLAMLRLATADLPWAVVDDFELTSPVPNYSYLTARTFRLRFPHARLYWIMGGDQWDALPTWKHPEQLAADVEFIVIPRGHPPQPRPGYRLHSVPGSHPASSTLIRTGASSHHLPPAVAAYIATHHLYQ